MYPRKILVLIKFKFKYIHKNCPFFHFSYSHVKNTAHICIHSKKKNLSLGFVEGKSLTGAPGRP